MIKYIFLTLFYFTACTNNPKKNDTPPMKEGDRFEVDSSSGIVQVGIKASTYSDDYNKAAQLINEKHFYEAIKIYEQLARIEKDSLKTYAYMGLASAYVLNGDYQLAIINFKKSIQLDSNNVESIIGLGSVNYNLKNFKKSVSYYEVAKSKEPKNPSCYWGLAISYDKLGFKSKVKANAKIFMDLQPNSNYLYIMKAILNE